MSTRGLEPVNPSVAPTATLQIVLALAALYFIWGSTYLAIKLAVETYPPNLMLAIRFLVAGGLLYLYLRARGTPNPTRSQWLGSLLIGTLLLVGGTGGVTLAEAWGVPSGLAAVVVATMPLWLALFFRFWGERLGRWEYLGMAFGLVGVALLNTGGDLRASPLATLMIFLAPVSWALGSALSRSVAQPSGPMASAAQMLGGGVVFALVALLRGEAVGTPSAGSSLALIYLITFGSLVAFSAYVYLLGQRVRPALLGSYTYVNPLVAVLLGVGLAGEQVGLLSVLGMLVALGGVVLTVTARSARRVRPVKL